MNEIEQKKSNIFEIVTPYRGMVAFLVVCALISNGVTLFIPKLIARGIDTFITTHGANTKITTLFVIASITIFIFTALQSIIQVIASERVARDMRSKLAGKISESSTAWIQSHNPAKLLTNLTSDIDSIKVFVSQVIVSMVSSVVIIIGSAVMLLTLEWRLAIPVLLIIPIIAFTFGTVFKKVRVLFLEARGVVDSLNTVINESILGAMLIRIVNSMHIEHAKFTEVNTKAKNVGFQILKLFAAMIPIVVFVANIATLVIMTLGGHFVIGGTMSLGTFAAFTSYLAILIFPIFVIGFMSSLIAQATTSYERVQLVLSAPSPAPSGSYTGALSGALSLNNVTLEYGEKTVLKDISFEIKPRTRTAIIGPTAAGKTQLLSVMTGITKPTSGTVLYDGHALDEYDPLTFHKHLGIVFQDSIMFNMTIRENIAFSKTVTNEALKRAIDAAELDDFIGTLPQGLDTLVSERGLSLSGGQKQRIMLARALALEPTILILDDFTARVDAKTEEHIITNIKAMYPNLTLISVTQKITSVGDFDTVILLMEGELLAQGTHAHLLKTSPEYAQMYASQESTHTYELHA